MVEGVESLGPLVEEFGSAAVYCWGIAMFGYPPSWKLGVEQLMKLEETLESKRKERHVTEAR